MPDHTFEIHDKDNDRNLEIDVRHLGDSAYEYMAGQFGEYSGIVTIKDVESTDIVVTMPAVLREILISISMQDMQRDNKKQ